jgi:hypothetical protein
MTEEQLKAMSNAVIKLRLVMVAEDQKAPLILEMRKRAFVVGLADRLAGRPLMARDDDGDDEYWVDAYCAGYDPREEMGLTLPEFLEVQKATIVELTALTGSVIPEVLPYNRCEFPGGAPKADVFTVEIPIVGTVTADSVHELGDAAWHRVHNAPNGRGTGYGASEVGSSWPVKKNGVLIGTMRYNGKFDPAVAS